VLLPCTSRGAQKKLQSRSRSQDDRGTRYTFLIMLAKDIPVQSPRQFSGSAAQAEHHPVLKLFMNTLGHLALLLSLPHPISNYHCSVSTCVKLQALTHVIVLYRFAICFSMGRHALPRTTSRPPFFSSLSHSSSGNPADSAV
jgi:hypothetical protein